MATPIPQNVAPFSRSEVEAAASARCAGAWDAVRGVVTDSRESVEGKLFVALSGESFDGHRFVDDVLARGAACAVVERELIPSRDRPTATVASALDALGQLAAHHRQRWGRLLVAVGGAAGKTTTRIAISSVLREIRGERVHYSDGNLNNRVGVPMVLLGLTDGHDICVAELGTNQTGEVETLRRMTTPDIAVMTLVAIEHSEGLGGIDAIEDEEGALFQGLSPDAIAIGNVDDSRVARLLRDCGARQVGYGSAEDADYRLVSRTPIGTTGSSLLIERPCQPSELQGEREMVRVDSPLIGYPGSLAVTAALAVADQLDGSPIRGEILARALADGFRPEPGRLFPCELADGTLVLDDSYNANPASVRSSMECAREIAEARGARLVLVLGEMRELGEWAAPEHRDIGSSLPAFSPGWVLAIGGQAVGYLSSLGDIPNHFVEDAAGAASWVVNHVEAGDVVLVKASRGVRAERVVDALVKARGSLA